MIAGRRIASYDRGTGEAVLLLHPGFVADGMVPLLDRPPLAGYRLIAPHRRGYGGSEPGHGPVGLPELARDVLDLLDALGIERAHLVGHSFGGCVALEVARTAPQRVARLALLEPPLGFALSESSLALLMATAGEAIPRFASGDHAGAVATWLDGAFGPGWQEPLERALPGAVGQATRDAPAAFGTELPALQAWPFGPPDLAAIRTPMLSLVHADAWPGFTEVHEALVAVGAEPALVPVRSHLLQVLDPDAVAGAIAAFLGSARTEMVGGSGSASAHARSAAPGP
jgi:pimeloyl-ACP methyl ester carboxylesterase